MHRSFYYYIAAAAAIPIAGILHIDNTRFCVMHHLSLFVAADGSDADDGNDGNDEYF